MKKAHGLICGAGAALFFLFGGASAGCRQEPEIVEKIVSEPVRETVYAEALRIAGQPEKVCYILGDGLDLDGLSVVFVQADGTERELAREAYSVEPPDGTPLDQAGNQDIRIVYEGYDALFRVAVLEPVFAFRAQPKDVEIPLYEAEIPLEAAVFSDRNGELFWRWFRKNPQDGEFLPVYESERIGVESGKSYSVPLPPQERSSWMNSEYYCTATLVSGGSEKSVDSDVVSVRRTVAAGIPVVTVDTRNVPVADKEHWISGTISVSGADNAGWNFDAVETSIRGRGNSTWNQKKKPYAVKLGKKQEVLGMPKHKRWVLIANYLDNSFIKNEMAFCLSRQLGMEWTVGGEFVHLVLNGEFLGLYWLGEAIKADENRVAIDEDVDYLMELDTYFDETWKFKSKIKNLPYNIKNDDSMTDERLEYIEARIAEIEDGLYADGSVDFRHIDVDSFAQFYVVNEVMRNGELGHPKSCYVVFDTASSLLKAGPVWDFDWAAGSKETGFINKETVYFDALFKTPEFNGAVLQCAAMLDALAACVRADEIRRTISSAVELDALRWGVHPDPVGTPPQDSFEEDFEFVKDVLKNRIAWIKGESFSAPEQ